MNEEVNKENFTRDVQILHLIHIGKTSYYITVIVQYIK